MLTFRVSQVRFESHINAQLLTGWDVLNRSLGIDTELAIVAVCLSDNTNALDQLDGKLFYPLIWVSYQLETAYPTAIRKIDVASIRLKLPPIVFVLDTAVVVLKLGIAFLARFLLLAVVIEARNCKPCTIQHSLSGLGSKLAEQRETLWKDRAVLVQVVLC